LTGEGGWASAGCRLELWAEVIAATGCPVCSLSAYSLCLCVRAVRVPKARLRSTYHRPLPLHVFGGSSVVVRVVVGCRGRTHAACGLTSSVLLFPFLPHQQSHTHARTHARTRSPQPTPPHQPHRNILFHRTRCTSGPACCRWVWARQTWPGPPLWVASSRRCRCGVDAPTGLAQTMHCACWPLAGTGMR
jgi:hypothetical protein